MEKNKQHKEETKTFTTEEVGRIMKEAAFRMILETSCNPFDCGDRDAHPWSSYHEEVPEQNNANTMGSVFKVTRQGEKKLANKTLREFNNGCKQSGLRFVANTSIIGGYYVDDETGDCYKWKPTTFGEGKKSLRKITEDVIKEMLENGEFEHMELLEMLDYAQEFCIISPEAEGMSDEEIETSKRSMVRILRQHGAKFIEQQGCWGGKPEPSFTIIGLTEHDCAEISAQFKQESYIIARRSNEGNCGYHFEFYTSANKDGNYSLSDESDNITTEESGIAGGYTDIRGFKYAIVL